MVEVYLSSNLQANPAMEIRYMNYSYRSSKWKLYKDFLIISWISSTHSSALKYRKRHRCHELREAKSQPQAQLFISLLYEFDRLLSWELPFCFMYSQWIMKWKLYQNFLIILRTSNPQSSEFMYRKRHRCHELREAKSQPQAQLF